MRPHDVEELAVQLARLDSPIVTEVTASDVEPSLLAARLRKAGFNVVAWSATGISNPAQSLIKAVVEQLDLADVRAFNWEALSEDLQWRAETLQRPVALLLRDAQAFKAADTVQWRQALDLFKRRGRDWQRAGSILKVVLFA